MKHRYFWNIVPSKNRCVSEQGARTDDVLLLPSKRIPIGLPFGGTLTRSRRLRPACLDTDCSLQGDKTAIWSRTQVACTGRPHIPAHVGQTIEPNL